MDSGRTRRGDRDIIKLPEGWIQTEFGEIFSLQYGTALPERERSGTGYPVYGSNGIVGLHDTALTTGETLIVGRKGSVGAVHFSDSPCWPIDTTYFIDSLHGMSGRYWLYQLQHLALWKNNRFTAIPGLNREETYKKLVVIPPINEQHRIASRLDEVISRVDLCKNKLDKVPILLKKFRKSILSSAISGKLTQDWRHEHNRPHTSWTVKTGKEIFSIITSGSRGWSSYYSESGARFLRISNLNYETINLDLEDLQYVNPPLGAEGKRTLIQVGDILISITAEIGMIGLVRDDLGEAYINQHICLARQTGEYSSAYLAYFLASPIGGLAQLTKVQKGSTKTGLTLGDIKELQIQIPSRDEQEEIVSRVESLLAFADRIENKYNLARNQIDRIPAALINKAMRGELVPQDPDDEPAFSILKKKQDKAPKETVKRKAHKTKLINMNSSFSINKLINILSKENDWLSSDEAFSRCGISNKSNIDQIEKIYKELRELDKSNKVEIEAVRDSQGHKLYDRIRLKN